MCLAVTLLVGVHIGQGTAQAIGGDTVAAATPLGNCLVFTTNGDAYYIERGAYGGIGSVVYQRNILGGAVQVEPTTWGNLKQKFVK
jgi:hypothetical protein